MNPTAMFRIGYGLYVVTAKDGKDNGCIVNTFSQVTSEPNRVSLTVNKQNYTHDMIASTGLFNVSMLTTATPFSVFEHFGFQTGRETDKFADFTKIGRSENGLIYLTQYTNAYISGRVIQSIDLGTHTMFIADVTAAEVFNDETSLTYDFYQKFVKPKPKKTKKKGWRCRICGYVYEGDELPADFTCPVCKHGAAAGENGEWTDMYPRMAEEARKEGFDDIAALFERVGAIEKGHEARYKKLLAKVEEETVFEEEAEVTWICRNCGYEVKAAAAPKVCPICSYGQSYFEKNIR